MFRVSLGDLLNLRRLALYGNRLRGQIPAELGGLPNLTTLSLSKNQLSGRIPRGIGRLPSLIWLHLDSNRLSGQIPTELGSISTIEVLHLNGNQLIGAFPQSLTGLSAMAQLRFQYNAGLCAPTDEAFQKWLNAIPDKSGDDCSVYHSADRAALVALYNATNGPSWRSGAHWLSDKPLSPNPPKEGLGDSP